MIAEHYEAEHPTPPPDEYARYLDYCKKSKGPVLEAMCGSGRFLVPLKKAGIEIEGMDGSEEMLTLCRKKLPSAALYLQRLEQLHLPKRYGFIFIPAKSLCVIPKPQLLPTLQKIAAHLLPDGYFVFDLWSSFTPTPPEVIEEITIQREDGSQFFSQKKYTHYQNRFSVHHKLWDNNGVEEESYEIELYDEGEMDPHLEATGFSLIRKRTELEFVSINGALFQRKHILYETKIA